MAALMFAELADLYKYGAPSRAFGSALTDADKTSAIGAASDEAYGSFRSRGQGAIIAWDTTVTKMVCQIAAYELMCIAGFNPNAGADRNYLDRALAARTWLRQVSKGEVTPVLTFDTPKAIGSAPQVRSRKRIGW